MSGNGSEWVNSVGIQFLLRSTEYTRFQIKISTCAMIIFKYEVRLQVHLGICLFTQS